MSRGVPIQNGGADAARTTSPAERLLALARKLDRSLASACDPARSDKDDERAEKNGPVHQLRVSSRRCETMLQVFKRSLPERERRRAVRALRRVRRAAGAIRDVEVHRALLHALRQSNPHGLGLDLVERAMRDDAERAHERLGEVAPRSVRMELWRTLRKLARAMSDLPGPPESSHAQRAEALAPLVERALRTASELDASPQAVHELRVDLKRVRYAIEALGVNSTHPRTSEDHAWLVRAQRRFGEFHDVATLVQRLDDVLERTPENKPEYAEVSLLRARLDAVRIRREQDAISWWRETRGPDRLRSMLAPQSPPPPAPAPVVPTASQTAPAHNGAASPLAGQGNLFLAGARVGVIDIGSNGIRLLAVELIDDRSWRVLVEDRATARLAQGMCERSRLSIEAMERGVAVVEQFAKRARELGAVVHAFATAAVRDARNREEFLSLVRARTGMDVRILSAREEGRLTCRAVARRVDLSSGNACVVDIGGGSMEVVLLREGVITRNASMRLGAVRMSERFTKRGEYSKARARALRAHADVVLSEHLPDVSEPPATLVGCGGTFTTLLMLVAASRGEVLERSDPRLREIGPVSLPEVRAIARELARTPLARRLRTRGLPADRADIAPAGLMVIERLMQHLGATHVRAHTGGVREGVLQEIVEAMGGSGQRRADSHVRAGSAAALLRKCRVDHAHCERVARLSLQLHDALRAADLPGFTGGDERRDRDLLEAAGLLHDVGIMVEYRAHHKHSREIVLNADLPGWDERDREILAQLCRYHRRAEPCARHKSYASLSALDRRVVRRLAGVLRVGDGLDRSHAGVVSGVTVRRGDDEVIIEAIASADATTEVAAARSKAGLLERELGCGVTIRAVRADPPLVVMPVREGAAG